MLLNFGAALEALNGADTAFTIINTARPAADYLFATVLPEMNKPTFDAKSSTMKMRTTMAGISGMDSFYAKVGAISLTTMAEQTLKSTSEVTMNEATQRELRAILQYMAATNGGAIDQAFMVNEATNFLNKLIVQSHLDMSEWMRGQALGNGELAFTYNGITIAVDYNIPTDNLLAQRSGTARYGGSASEFWNDVYSIQRILGFNVRAITIHPTLWLQVLSQSANNIHVTSQDGMLFNIRRKLAANDLSTDARDTVQIVVYGKEGEVYDPATPGETIKLPFHPTNKMVGIGNGGGNSPYIVGQGSTPDVPGALGYHHLGPTIEDVNGRLGRWARLFTPQDRQYELRAQGVANELPIIDRPELLVIAESDLA